MTDLATQLTHAEFGAFFYNVIDAKSGDAYMLYTLSGAPERGVRAFPQPRATAVFAPTFHGEGIGPPGRCHAGPTLRKNPPYHGMPKGHLPVRSYLAVPVKALRRACSADCSLATRSPVCSPNSTNNWRRASPPGRRSRSRMPGCTVRRSDADRLKDEFLAVLSHELRTPLNAIVGYARLLRGGMLSGEKASRGLETLERNATSLTQIVEDVLDVSRIVSGKIRLDVQPVELPLIVHNAVATVQPAADAKGVRDPDDHRSARRPGLRRSRSTAAGRLELLSNAVKFTPKDGRVQVRVERVNSHIEIVVSDTGVGIRPDFLPHVFERFRQADAGTDAQDRRIGAWARRSCDTSSRCTAAPCTRPVTAKDKGRRSGCGCRLMIVHDAGSRENRANTHGRKHWRR